MFAVKKFHSTAYVGNKAEVLLVYRHRHRLYGHVDWSHHKSRWRHARHMWTLVWSSSPNFVTTSPPIIALCTLNAMFAATINYWVSKGQLPDSVPLFIISSFPFTLSAPSLAILLVFRINVTFGRFDEARRLWGLSVIRTRDLARQALAWIRNPTDARKMECLLRHIKAYPYCLKDHLTEGNTVYEELIGVLEPRELEGVMGARHKPNYVLQVMSEVLMRCRMSIWEKLAMDKGVEDFHGITGACERIFNTPIPVPLTRMTSRILILWHLGLPHGLWSFCGWLTIPITFVSAAGFFFIEEVGVMIEEPFWVLALLALNNAMKTVVEGLEVAHKGASVLCNSLDGGTTHQQQAHEVVNPLRNIETDDQVAVALQSNSVDWGSPLGASSSPVGVQPHWDLETRVV